MWIVDFDIYLVVRRCGGESGPGLHFISQAWFGVIVRTGKFRAAEEMQAQLRGLMCYLACSIHGWLGLNLYL